MTLYIARAAASASNALSKRLPTAPQAVRAGRGASAAGTQSRPMSYMSAMSEGEGEQRGMPTRLNTETRMRRGKMPPRMPSVAMGTRLRKSPFFQATLEEGCQDYTVYNHMLMPTGFSHVSPEDEYWALRNDVCIWDVSAQRQVQLEGPDAKQLCQILCTRNLSKIKVGDGLYTLMLDEDGTVINDPVVCRVAEDKYWLSIADADILLWTKAHALASSTGSKLDVKITEPDVSPLALQGPKAVTLVQELFGDQASDLGYFKLHNTQDAANASLKHLMHPELRNIPITLVRAGWSPEDGFELYLEDGKYGKLLWELLMVTGEKYGITPGAPNQSRRIETGMLSYGADTDESMNGLEVGLPRKFCNPTGTHNFIGKEALQAIEAAGGPTRRIMGVMIDGDPLPEAMVTKWHLHSKQNGPGHVGTIGSMAYSFQMKKVIAMAIVDNSYAEPGTRLTLVTNSGATREVTVSAFPFEGTESALKYKPS